MSLDTGSLQWTPQSHQALHESKEDGNAPTCINIAPLPLSWAWLGGGCDSSYESTISPMGGSFELYMHDLDSTCLFYKMVNVSHPHTQVLTGPT